MGENYGTVKGYLAGYQKSRTGWDVYASNIDTKDRLLLENIFGECRENGFVDPMVIGEGIVFSQIVQSYLSPPTKPMTVEEFNYPNPRELARLETEQARV